MPFKRLDRRTFLRAAGVSVGLPFLDAMVPAGLTQEHRRRPARARVVLIGRLGLHAPYLFPQQAGPNFEHTRYTRILDAQRGQFTVISGMSHRGYTDGHHNDVALMTGCSPEGIRLNDVRNTISLDQEVAAHIGTEIASDRWCWAARSIRGIAAGCACRLSTGPATSFASFSFREPRKKSPARFAGCATAAAFSTTCRTQARTMAENLGAADRQRLDLFLTSIREAEQRLQQDEAWVHRPKPRVDAPMPTNEVHQSGRLIDRSRQWFDLIHLALQTDSTRVITLSLDSQERPVIDGVTLGHHDASHHGQDPAKIEQLALIEEAELRTFSDFLTKLKNSSEGDGNFAGPHHGLSRQQPGQRLRPFAEQSADHPGRRRPAPPGARRFRSPE